jgi:hypothetical protein
MEVLDMKHEQSQPRASSAAPRMDRNTVALIAEGVGGLPPASLDFFAALGNVLFPSAYPHPVCARNFGLVPAWQRWTASMEGRSDNRSSTDQLIADPRYRFDQSAKLIKEAISVDPVWKRIVFNAGPGQEPDMGLDFLTAQLMFWRRQHALIELTPALQLLLARSDLGGDIPVDLLRPPMPACYIRFGDEMQLPALLPRQDGFAFTRIDGVYVFDTMFAGERGLSLIAIYDVGDHPGLGISGINVVIGDEREPLLHVVGGISATIGDEQRLHHQALAQMCTKVFLYWNVEQARRVEESPYTEAMQQLARLGPKKAAKLRRRVDHLYDRILLGPLTLPEHAHGARGEVSAHWRRGHFRMQPHGPQRSLRKVIFIAPMLVRADRLIEQPGLVPSGAPAA